MDLSESKSRQTEVDPEEIIQKVDLPGTTDWDSAEQQDVHNLICEYAYIFSQNDLDLGKISIVKHSIKLTESTSFKEHYQHIPQECMKKWESIYTGNASYKCYPSIWCSLVYILRLEIGVLAGGDGRGL